MEKRLDFTAKQITGIAVLLALVVVLQVALGSITIGAVTLNFTLIPIVLGGILFGSVAGLILGLACGVVVLIQVMLGGSPFYTLIWANDPVVTTLTCLVKSSVAGYLGGLSYTLLKKKQPIVAVFVASAIVPIVNTGLFIVGCLFMFDSVHTLSAVSGQNLLVFILVGLVTFNFFIELAINMVFAPAINRIIKIIKR
ncbi:MAG: ECF transporter S component [Clostridia bacterium]|nr:ECF transporter S component [Clostridia bacterium]